MIPKYLKDRLGLSIREQSKYFRQAISVGKPLPRPVAVVLSHHRSGAGLLHSYLKSHTWVWPFERLLGQKLEGEELRQKLEQTLRRPFKPPITCVAFHFFFEYEADARIEALDWLQESDAPVRIVHLRRDNLLRVWVSLKIAEKTDHWSIGHPRRWLSLEDRKVRVDPAEALEALNRLSAQEARVMSKIAGLPTFKMSYEELADAPNRTLLDLQGFLEVPVKRLYATQYRQNPEPLSALVENYEELRRALLPTRWASFLTEESRFY